MIFENDWMMRQIEVMTQFIARVLLRKESTAYEITERAELRETDLLYRRLRELLAKGEICKAEDLLFDALDADDPATLELAVDFYASLNKMSDQELEAADFSREEVMEGLESVSHKFGIEIPLA